MKNISGKSLICLAVFAMVLSLFGATFVMAEGTATVDVEITSATEVSFTTAALDFGEGTPASDGAILQSNGSGSVTGGDWTPVSGQLVLQNIAGTDVSLVLNSSATAAQFIGGTSPTFKWMVTNSSGEDSCEAANATFIYEQVNTTTGSTVCSRFYANDAKDSIDIDFELGIPYDATDLSATATITAIATAI